MKKLVGVAGLVTLFVAGTALGFDNSQVTVNAEIQDVCAFDLGDYVINLGLLDEVIGNSGSVTATITCSAAVTWNVTDISGAQTLTGTTLFEAIPYTMAMDKTSATGNGTVLFTASVAGPDITGHAVDTYQDIIPITVAP